MTEQDERLRVSDWVWSALVAFGTFLCGCLLSYPCLPPCAWGDAAVAAGLRPAAHVAGGLATLVAEGAFRLFGLAGGETVLRLLGPATLAGVATGVFIALRETLILTLRGRPQLSPNRRAVMQLGAALGAVAFVVSEPVWTCGQGFGEDLIQIALSVAALTLNLLFLRTGRVAFVSLAAFALGLLTVGTPVGLSATVGLVALDWFVLRPKPNLDAQDADDVASLSYAPCAPCVRGVPWAFALFLGGCVAGVALDALTFVRHEGLVAAGLVLRDVPLVYLREIFSTLVSATGCVGNLALIAVFCVPFAAMLACFPKAADEESFLPFTMGVVAFVCGLLALSQAACWPSFWCWSHVVVHSRILLALGLLANAFVLASAVVTFGVEVFCRDHARLAEEQLDAALPKSVGSFGRRAGFLAAAALALVALVVGVAQPTTREMLGVVRDAVREIVAEAGEARLLITDGSLDVAIEREAAALGRPLHCLSLMGGNSPRETFLRTCAFAADSEDRLDFTNDVAAGLTTWIREKPSRLDDVAALLGFDLWLRKGKPMPPMGGLLSRPAGFPSETVRAEGVRNARELAKRVLAVHERHGGLGGCADVKIRDAFLDVQWRLARMSAYRSDAAGRAEGDADAALAKILHERNPKSRGLARQLSVQDERNVWRSTSAQVNFKMGMRCVRQKQFLAAEIFLKRCLERLPDEPAVYNNLAMVQIELGRLDAAEENVAEALRLAPGAAAVLDTARRLKEARKR